MYNTSTVSNVSVEVVNKTTSILQKKKKKKNQPTTEPIKTNWPKQPS